MHSRTENSFFFPFLPNFPNKTNDTWNYSMIKSQSMYVSFKCSSSLSLGLQHIECQWVEMPTASRMRVYMFNDFFLSCCQCDCLQIHSNRKCEKWTLRFRFSKIDATYYCVRRLLSNNSGCTWIFRICFYTIFNCGRQSFARHFTDSRKWGTKISEIRIEVLSVWYFVRLSNITNQVQMELRAPLPVATNECGAKWKSSRQQCATLKIHSCFFI